MTREEAVQTIKGERWICCIEKYREALDMAIKALEQEPCEDAISRQAALECFDITNTRPGAKHAIETLPSVTPQPKTGHWIINEDEENTVHGHCSVCGWEAHYYEDDIIGMPYCPNCGAKMVEPQESEDKR